MCDYACRDSSTLRKHQDRHLGKYKAYPCKICDKVFKVKSRLKEHTDEKHYGVNVHKIPCEICGKMFKSKSVLSTHLNVVHARRYVCKCEICGVVKNSKSNLEMHMRSHVDIRPYKCTFEQCGKKFKVLGDLKKHIITHYPERQHPCPTCGRLFARLSRMKRHLTQHEPKVKSVECALCGVCFYNDNYLAVHMRKKHTRDIRYECDDCGFKTRNKPSIVMHIKYGHASETDTECEICKKVFKKHLYLKLHYWNTHSIKYKISPRIKRKKGITEEIQIKEELESVPEIDLLEVHKEEVFTDMEEEYYNGTEETEYNGTEETEYSKSVLSEDVTRVLDEGKGEELEKHSEQVFDEIMIQKIVKNTQDEGKNQVEVEVDVESQEKAKRCIEKLVIKSRRKREIEELEKTRQQYNQRMREAMNRKPKTERITIKFVNNRRNEDVANNEIAQSGDNDVNDSPITNDNDIINNIDDDESLNNANELTDNNDKETDDNQKESNNNDNETNEAGESRKNNKLKINTHQCYVCFNLFETKPQLIEHCKEHFDVCNTVMLKKCPLCDYVTKLNLSRHMRLVHKVTIKVPYGRLKDKKTNINGSRYYYDIEDSVVNHVEVIPSVKNLNKREYVKIDKKSREEKERSVAKTKLVKKGGEWVVEKEKIAVKDDFILPEFDAKDVLKIKEKGDDYLGRMKKLSRLAKGNGTKMLFPCENCEKICQTLSALKLHSRKHNPNAKPFKPKVWKHKMKGTEPVQKIEAPVNTENRYANPKPIKNKHKCEPELRDFYEKNIKGGDIEFWQFLKIYNKMSRENITDFSDLNKRIDFGIHYDETPKEVEEPVEINVTKKKKVKKPQKPGFTRVIKISKKEYLKRKELKDKLRETLSKGINS
ncbi:unnamed protein product [Parnassius apollo]|uniref:(apollo) hypothetical protein n=1 Tax=Parnassius apollo TaxID=110799 RepID=A0A8S3WC57_PARAO|nr:unnamed protein product [Parnassius apollo]